MLRQHYTHKVRIAFFHMQYCKCISTKFCLLSLIFHAACA